MPRRYVLVSVLLPLLLSPALACDRAAGIPPTAEFLLEAGDSTYWVRSGHAGIRVRRSPIVLARFDDRFYEVYVTDDDRSYYDAILVGQRLFRRDLITGDSASVFDDPAVPVLAREYASQHPGDRPLAPDEEGSQEPTTTATAEIEILELHGPYLSYEYHSDLEAGDDDRHVTRRGVIDLRSGQQVSVAEIFGDSAGRRIMADGRRLFLAALDSVLEARDDLARRAVDAIGEFEFDTSSFNLAEWDGAPAVAFSAPGRGARGGGLLLTTAAITAPAPPWWSTASNELPRLSADSSSDVWRHRGVGVVARADSAGETVAVAMVDSGGREWSIGTLGAPARRVLWLDEPMIDSASRKALSRAFDESVLYSDQVRVAFRRVRPAAPQGPRLLTVSLRATKSSAPRGHARARRVRQAS